MNLTGENMTAQKLSLTMLLIGGSAFLGHPAVFAQEPFSESACVARHTREVDKPFRLSTAKAVRKCKAIASRIALLSKQTVGQWQLSGTEIVRDFSADGTLREFQRGRASTTTTRHRWVIANVYDEPGEEHIYIDDNSSIWSFNIKGSVMIITYTPSRYTAVYRWRRIR
jgi:hypothetical protein